MEIEHAAGLTVAIGATGIALGSLWFSFESPQPNLRKYVAVEPTRETQLDQTNHIEPPHPVERSKKEGKPASKRRNNEWETVGNEPPELNEWQNTITRVTTREWQTHEGTREWSEAKGRELVTWNGQPAHDAMLKLLDDVSDPDVRTGWQQIRAENQISVDYLGDGVCREIFVTQRPQRGPLKTVGERELECGQIVICYAACPPDMSAELVAFWYLSHPWAIRLAENPLELPYFQRLLEDLHRNCYTLVVRYGVVCAVPIREQTLTVSDPVQIASIHFAAGSPQARDWLMEVPPIDLAIYSPAERAQALFAGTSIKVDPSLLKLEPDPMKSKPAPAQMEQAVDRNLNTADKFKNKASPYLRTRRDTLAMLLWHRNLAVEQMADTLVIKPRD